MNANSIIKEEMSLEEKLAAIDAAMNDRGRQVEYNTSRGLPADAPVDPADLTMCEGCQ